MNVMKLGAKENEFGTKTRWSWCKPDTLISARCPNFRNSGGEGHKK
jgi:hypothetical protein